MAKGRSAGGGKETVRVGGGPLGGPRWGGQCVKW